MLMHGPEDGFKSLADLVTKLEGPGMGARQMLAVFPLGNAEFHAHGVVIDVGPDRLSGKTDRRSGGAQTADIHGDSSRGALQQNPSRQEPGPQGGVRRIKQVIRFDLLLAEARDQQSFGIDEYKIAATRPDILSVRIRSSEQIKQRE